MKEVNFYSDGRLWHSQDVVIKSEYSDYNGEETNAQIAVTFSPGKEGVELLLCLGHDNEIFEDNETLKIPLKNILDAACSWGDGDFHAFNNTNYYTNKSMASYLRMMADTYELMAEDYRDTDSPAYKKRLAEFKKKIKSTKGSDNG